MVLRQVFGINRYIYVVNLKAIYAYGCFKVDLYYSQYSDLKVIQSEGIAEEEMLQVSYKSAIYKGK